KDNALLRIDARVKILSAFCLLFMVLTYKGFAFPLLTALVCLFFCTAMKIPPRAVIMRFSEPMFIAAMVLLLKFFFSGKDVLFSAQIIGIRIVGHKDGLMAGLQIASRILGA